MTDQVLSEFTVQGESASRLEYAISLALDSLKLQYDFQYDLFGGKGNLPGGISVDFVVYTPTPVPLEAQGNRWHEGLLGADDWYRNRRVEQEFNHLIVEIWEDEVFIAGTDQTLSDAVRRSVSLVQERVL